MRPIHRLAPERPFPRLRSYHPTRAPSPFRRKASADERTRPVQRPGCTLLNFGSTIRIGAEIGAARACKEVFPRGDAVEFGARSEIGAWEHRKRVDRICATILKRRHCHQRQRIVIVSIFRRAEGGLNAWQAKTPATP